MLKTQTQRGSKTDFSELVLHLNRRISNMDVEGTCTLKTVDREEKDF